MRGNLAHGSSTTAQIAFGAQASCVATAMISFLIYRRIPFVRRPFYQRDEAIVQRDRAAAERDRALSERDALALEREVLIADRAAAERDALVAQRDRALSERDALALERAALIAEREELTRYTGTLGATLQYRLGIFRNEGPYRSRPRLADGAVLAKARQWAFL